MHPTGRPLALDAFALRPTPRVPSFEVLEHPALIREVTGIDPFERPLEAWPRACEALGIDWIVDIPRTTYRFAPGEEVRDLGGGERVTEWGCSGSLWAEESGFSTVDDVLSFRPREDDRGVRVLQPAYQEERRRSALEAQAVAGDSVLVTGLYYTLLFQFCIMIFGWERFLEAAASDPEAFTVVLDQLAEVSRANVAAWAATDNPVLFVHDDVAVTRGLVFSPAWCRRELLPRYERILEPAFSAGKSVVFVSDGRFEELVDDLFAVGIHGVMVDHNNNLERILTRHGATRVVVGSVDTAVLTRCTPAEVRAAVQRCMELGRGCPGFFLKAAGDIPHNIPLANAHAYIDAKRELGARR
jgi:hypothetical protein